MSVYMLIETRVHEDGKAAYGEYIRTVAPIVQQYGGRYLVRGGAITTVVGDWHPERIILMEFPSIERIRTWLASPEYRAIAPLRELSVETRAVVLEAYEDTVSPSYSLEHIGILVEDPLAMAEWYRRVLGFRVHLAVQEEDKAVTFLSDQGGRVMLELGKLPGLVPTGEQLSHPLQFHIALFSTDLEVDRQQLMANGARFIEECPVKRPGERLLLFKDPWGHSLQLVTRTEQIQKNTPD